MAAVTSITGNNFQASFNECDTAFALGGIYKSQRDFSR